MNNPYIEKSFHKDSMLPLNILCFSHLRWDFVYQRPQHLLSRFAREGQVFYFEEPIFSDEPSRLDVSRREGGLSILVPRLNSAEASNNVDEILREMLDKFLDYEEIENFVAWYYTPMALGFTSHLKPLATVYDCMDELSAFKFAPPELREREAKLFEKADVVFTGGQSLFEAKQLQHSNIHAMPSSIDVVHFAQARVMTDEPVDQRDIPAPKLGFCGVIDERMDLDLLDKISALRPSWHFVMIGPVVKIDEQSLPRRNNIHYLGGKSYQDLPQYIAGWDVALLTFALNDSTKFISPTKTPEYLAAGKPVVSTPIRDVVHPYYDEGLVYIACTPEGFITAAETAMQEHSAAKIEQADQFLSQNSWEKTWTRVANLIEDSIIKKQKTKSVAEGI